MNLYVKIEKTNRVNCGPGVSWVGPWEPLGLGDPWALGTLGPWGPWALGTFGPWGPLGLGDPGPWGPLGPRGPYIIQKLSQK